MMGMSNIWVEQSCVQAARDLLGMLMLRRTKAEVLAKELPPKREEVVTIEMAPVQKDIYRKLLLICNSFTLFKIQNSFFSNMQCNEVIK